MSKNEIEKIVEKTGIEKANAAAIWGHFSGYFDSATMCASKVEGLEITDVSQKEEMALARATRIALKNIRVASKKTKDELKADIIKEGKFIDATFNLIANTTQPIEADLLEKENFAKNKEAERVARLVAERQGALADLEVGTQFLDLAKMSGDDFGALLQKSELEYEERIEAQRKAEEERIANEKAASEERARIEEENRRLRAEAAEREQQLAEERAKVEAERRAREESDRREREAREAADRAEREKQEAATRKAQEEAAAAQRKLREKEEAEERARIDEAERIDAQRRAEEEEHLRLEAAGDKEKLLAYFDAVMAIDVPSVSSQDAREVLAMMRQRLQLCVTRAEKL